MNIPNDWQNAVQKILASYKPTDSDNSEYVTNVQIILQDNKEIANMNGEMDIENLLEYLFKEVSEVKKKIEAAQQEIKDLKAQEEQMQKEIEKLNKEIQSFRRDVKDIAGSRLVTKIKLNQKQKTPEKQIEDNERKIRISRGTIKDIRQKISEATNALNSLQN